MTKMTIQEIRALSEAEAKAMAIERVCIKGYTIYFVNLGEYFGYSYLVFKNGSIIEHANDYELHHRHQVETKGYGSLKKFYVKNASKNLYTEEELKSPLKDYDDYHRRMNFLINIYGLEKETISAVRIMDSEEERIQFKKSVENMILDKVNCSYYKQKDIETVRNHYRLLEEVNKCLEDTKTDYAFLKEAFKYEMVNHEVFLSYTPHYDTLSSLSMFADIPYSEDDDLNKYFACLKFNNTQKKAYLDAYKEYVNEAEKVF